MTVISTRTSKKLKRVGHSAASKANASRRRKPSKARVTADKPDDHPPHNPRVTKHDRILALLSQPDGATIPELMKATGWQQHSLRGFFAATVKKKLGLNLTSKKLDGELRRYRVVSKRGR